METKYPPKPPHCAVCGRVVRGSGWFCSFACDKAELKDRFGANKALFIARGGNDPE